MTPATQHIRMAPSILSANFMALGDDVKLVAAGGADCIHFDVMDGHFVPNLTLGVPFVSAMRKITDAPLDVHLMISNPADTVRWYLDAGADIVTVHIEAFDSLGAAAATLDEIRSAGCRSGIAVNPETPVDGVLEILPHADTAMVMTVHPGFGGQSFMHECLPKLSVIRDRAVELGLEIEIEVDGGINLETAPLAAAAGATLLVAGSAVFGKSDPVAAMNAIRSSAVAGCAAAVSTAADGTAAGRADGGCTDAR